MKYFAYGSNMDHGQLESRIGQTALVGNGRLPNHQFRINQRGVATVVTCPSAQVYGLIWELNESQLAVMDRYEGVAAGHYRRCDVLIHANESVETCITYVATVSEAGQPRSEYLERIIASAKNAGFPQQYLDELCTWTNQ